MGKNRSQRFFEQAKELFPGGVNSPVRAFNAVGGDPRFIAQAKGAYLTDVDGMSYIDFVGSWGPMIAGHAHPKVIEAIQQAASLGTSYGAPCPGEISLAKQVLRRFPNMEKIRWVNSGTEAVMGAVRLARGATGRNKILKFSGCYHGHADYLLVKAGSGALTQGNPDSLGVPQDFAKHTLIAPYNDLPAVSRWVEHHGEDLAAILVEPIAGNMGVVLPKRGFLSGLKKLCRRSGALLIFDEVMTGFRVHPHSAQGLFKIKPDITVLGKIIGGGLPVGAYGASRKLMDQISPGGGIYQAGTLSGNPLAMAAGLATLQTLQSRTTYARLEQKTARLAQGLQNIARESGIDAQVPYVCGMLSLFFAKKPVENLEEVMESRHTLFKPFFWEMLKRGVYLPPSPFEAWFVSLAHGENEIAKTLRAAKDSFGIIRKNL